MAPRNRNAAPNSFRQFAAMAVGLAAFLLTGSSRADEDIPTYKTLFCEQSCPAFVPASPIDQPKPGYPVRDIGAYDVEVEAQVDVRYTIATDGSVKEAEVENLIGPQEFADSALEAVKDYKFRPATENGQPVEQNRRVRFEYYIDGDNKGARAEIVSAYNSAIRELHDNKTDDAVVALKAIIGKERLNFYERTMVSYVLAQIYASEKNYPLALDAIRTATLMEGKFLGVNVRSDALRLRIQLEAATGEFSNAFLWFDILGKHATIDNGDPTAKLIAKLHVTLDSNEVLTSEAAIAPDGTSWHHTLLRRSFEFGDIAGTLSKFELRCERHGIESPVSDKANWTVPASWSGCEIYVSGNPGTKFKFYESVPPAAADQSKPTPKG